MIFCLRLLLSIFLVINGSFLFINAVALLGWETNSLNFAVT